MIRYPPALIKKGVATDLASGLHYHHSSSNRSEMASCSRSPAKRSHIQSPCNGQRTSNRPSVANESIWLKQAQINFLKCYTVTENFLDIIVWNQWDFWDTLTSFEKIVVGGGRIGPPQPSHYLQS